MTQLVTRIDEDMAAQLDQLVATGEFNSRSDAVRRGLAALIDTHQRRRIGDAISDGYRRLPQTQQEMGWADSATASMIAEEPW